MDTFAQKYPLFAGYKEHTTSREAAESTDAAHIRGLVRAALRRWGAMSADDCAERIGLDRLSVRPRFSELKAAGKIENTGRKTLNRSGKKAIVWELV